MAYNGIDRSDAFFAHHGIKGQKWGIRRFQNEDGTLTEEGLKRYGHDYDKKGRLKRSAKKDDEKLIKDMRKVYNLHRKSRVASMKASNRLVDMVKEDQKAGKHVTDISDDKKLDKHIGKMEKYAAKREEELEKIMVDYITKHGSLRLDDVLDIAASKASTTGSINNPYLNEMYATYNEVIKGAAHRVDEKTKDFAHEGNDGAAITFDDVIGIAIAHSGIKGQKWGLRRFQYDDGSLTPEGRKRYLKGGDKEIRKAEKERARREAILSDRKKLYKHRGEFSKAEIDKAMEKFAAEDQLKDQMNAEKAAKQQAKMDAQKARAALVQSKADYKKMKMQLKLNKQAEDLKRKTQQMQAEEQKKQAKLKTESDKLALESKQETADISAKAEKWKQRANKARSVYDFAKVGQEILSDMGITSKNGNESLFGALAESIGLKDNSAIKAAEARKKAIAKETEDLNLESLRLKVMGERRTFDNNYEEDRKKRAREGIEEAERQAKKAYQDKIDDAKLRQELAKAAKAEYDAANPNKGGKGGGASLDDIEDLLRKYDLI